MAQTRSIVGIAPALRGGAMSMQCGLSMLFLLTSCGDDDEQSSGCRVEAADGGGAVVRCGDDAPIRIPGAVPGRDGGGGSAGDSCSVSESAGEITIRCDDGSSVTVPVPGREPGEPGDAGEQGEPGSAAPVGWVTGPGLVIEVLEASIDAERHPLARLRITDGDGVALDREGKLTPGAIEPRFTVAVLGSELASLENYILAPQTSPITSDTRDLPGSESDGTWQVVDADAGEYEYRFTTVLPEGYDESLTHTIALWATRTVESVRYADDAWIHFRPDGEDVTQVRDIVDTDSCNVCHNPLALHGEQRLSVPLCITCHTPQGVDPDTGNSLDFKVMVHKIHRGESLPSVESGTPYQIIGFSQSVHDYSDVVFPHEINDCQTCHTGEQADRWKTNPSQEACGSCHDNVDFSIAVPDPDTGDDIIPHPGGPKTNDTCTNCHATQPAGLPGLAVEDAHLHGRLNPNTPVLEVEILDAVDTGPSETPIVTFRVRVDGVGRDLLTTPLERLSLVLAGPTRDFAGERSYSPQADDLSSATDQLVAVDAVNGVFAYTLPQTVMEAAAAFSTPVAAEGSFGFMMEARQTFTVALADGSTEDVRVAAHNPVRYVAVTDAEVVPRREVVDMDKCNGCHRDLYFHGDTRTVAEACVFCHTGNRDTFGRMPTPAAGQTLVATTARLGPMIHRIHGSAIADGPFTLWGNGGVALDFSDIRFPGAAQDCLTCHVEGAYDLPLPEGLLPSTTRIKNDQGLSAGVASVVPPTAASCRGCHDSAAVATHAEIMTSATGEESCAVCHGVGKSAGLDIVHARPEWDY